MGEQSQSLPLPGLNFTEAHRAEAPNNLDCSGRHGRPGHGRRAPRQPMRTVRLTPNTADSSRKDAQAIGIHSLDVPTQAVTHHGFQCFESLPSTSLL